MVLKVVFVVVFFLTWNVLRDKLVWKRIVDSPSSERLHFRAGPDRIRPVVAEKQRARDVAGITLPIMGGRSTVSQLKGHGVMVAKNAATTILFTAPGKRTCPGLASPPYPEGEDIYRRWQNRVL